METKTSETSKVQVYGSFFLGTSEFALSVKKVREVVNPPQSLTTMPLSPDYLKGVFNLRGAIIPVIDLRKIFGIEGTDSGELSKIAIIEHGKFCFGILFDRTGDVFRSQENEMSEFSSRPNSIAGQVISGVFKKDEGRRILQILDVEALFKLENIPFEASNDSGSLDGQRRKFQRGSRKQCISFVVGNSRCALPIDEIHEIIKVEKINESALAMHQCIGMIDLRGITVPIIDFAAMLGFREIDRGPNATAGDRRVIVMRLGNELFGLVVDCVESIISFFADDLIKFPVLIKSRSEMIVGCLSRESESDILLLDSSKILSNEEIIEITHGHNKIYQAKTDNHDVASGKRKTGVKSTVITFTLESRFAVAIDEVREIIDFPQNLLHPPGLAPHFKGVLNLRGDLVTIIDTRCMYALGPIEFSNCKVLVFKDEGVRYGLIVDSVDEILSFNVDEKMKLPDVLYKNGKNQMVEDVQEAVEVGAEDQRKSLLILNIKAVYERVGKSKAA